ncbi:TonB-dependent siderophore receptor [Paracoccus aminophilus]|uniref:Outer membrane ferric siderophore receptor n=1 Tax=Paracoccus aminophilus JCM 7686 TaxID=1367847 RepID=S5XMW4_PARAH|nr:TonB-dependent siderophore receptor [Paracoccus aminophilus]AGT08609.1 outer membrane ferric siderophore receptor [Paracoccus aminophilus JCM 7686]
MRMTPLSLPAVMRLTTAFGSGLLVMAVAAGAQDASDQTIDNAVTLDTVVLTAAPATTTEDSGSWTTEWMRSATGLVLSQKETPQSTSAITAEQMKDRSITTISDVMTAATGITVQALESDRISYFSRGFRVDAYQYDGVPVPSSGASEFGRNNADMVLYDHVEFVRGATGLMQGAGEPGASINFIRKRPTEEFRSEAALSFAHPKGGRIEGDISGALNENGTVRGRLVGAYDNRDGSIDGYNKKKYVVYGALDVDLTDNTTLSAGLTYQKTKATGSTWGGLVPFYSDGTLIDWPKGASNGADWTYADTKRTEAFLSLEHIFDNGWTGRVVYTHVNNDSDTAVLWISGIWDPVTGTVARPDRVTGEGLEGYGRRFYGGNKQDNLNAILNGDFQAFGRDHHFVVGAMASSGKGDYYGNPPGPDFPININNMNGHYPAPPASNAVDFASISKTKEYAIYGTTRLSITDQFAILAGSRISWWDGEEGSGGTPTAKYKISAKATPYLGFTYDINPTYTAYGSIASIYKPTLERDVNKQYLKPTDGWNYELGVKAGFLDDRLLASAAIFQTNQKNVPNYVDWIAEENRAVYESIDGTKTRGFELEAAGAINDRWNVSGGYTYRSSKDNNGIKRYVDQSAHTLKLATDYRVANILDDKLTLGGAVRWQSATDSMVFTQTSGPNVHQGSYSVWDLNAAYDINDKAEVILSVNNLFDKKYYATTGFYSTVVYGDQRSAEITLRAKF